MTVRARSLSIVAAAALAILAPSPAAAQPGAPPAIAPKLTRPPKLVTFVEALYPEAERASGKTATVVLQIAISATGAVDRAAVTESGGPSFDAAAIAAVQRFVFEPAEIDGKPAPIKILYRYEFTLRAEVPTTGVFDGVVRSRKSKRPLAGVTVLLDSGQRATTDAAGHFHVDVVTPGKHALALEGEKLTALRTEETFEAGKRLDVTYDVEEREEAAKEGEGDDLEIVITAPPIRKQVVSTEVSAEQGRRVPGAQGDVLRVVENLPGVARSTVGSGALVVWGASPEDTRVYVDGVRVPRLYHDGDDRSFQIIGPRLLAIAATPAEAEPKAQVTFRALYVDPEGERTRGDLAWAFCTARKPLTEQGTVSPECVREDGPELAALGSGAAITGALPDDGCRLFGPDRPAPVAGEPVGRAVDPDPSGGFYQPVRLRVRDSEVPVSMAIGAARRRGRRDRRARRAHHAARRMGRVPDLARVR